MLAAEIWHWWIGVALTGAGVLVAVGLIGAYLKAVSAQRYPGGRRRRESDL
ncbi:MAG: hypothetical protein HKN44_09910 [Ilumatobacter sp.]|nr:hypothetical protein [Ilumatobacter sp.]